VPLSPGKQCFAYTKNVRINLGTLPVAAGVSCREQSSKSRGSVPMASGPTRCRTSRASSVGSGRLARAQVDVESRREGRVLEHRTETRGLSRIALAAPPPAAEARECSGGSDAGSGP
jgi:hypothetical protein